MPFIDSTQLNDLQSRQASNEKRFRKFGLARAVKDSTAFTDFLSPQDKAELSKTSSLKNVQIPVIQDQTVTVVTTPGFSFIPSNLASTAQYTFTAYDVFSGARFYESAFADNAISADYYRDQVYMNVLEGMGAQVENILAARFEERKTQKLNFTTQVSQGDGSFTFSEVTDTLTINQAAQKETMLPNLGALMEANDLEGEYRTVTSRAGLQVQKTEMAKYGAQNEKNLQALGILDASRIYESNTLTPGSDVFQGWFFRDGAIGMIENFPYDFRNGTVVNGKKWSVSDVALPFINMRANIYTNHDAADGTSIVTGTDSNLIMSKFEEMAIWARFYVVYRYNSDLANRVNDVLKITGSTS